MKLRSTLMAAAAFVTLSSAAFAVPLSGTFFATSSPVTFDSVNAADASEIKFPSGTFDKFTPNFTAPSTLTACSNCGTINTISGIPMTASGSFSGVSPLFSVEGLSFSLTALTEVDRTNSANGSSLTLIGTGTYTFGDYDPTAGRFQITINNDTMQISVGSSSASGGTTGVPEPMSLALLGSGLAAVGLVRRHRRS